MTVKDWIGCTLIVVLLIGLGVLVFSMPKSRQVAAWCVVNGKKVDYSGHTVRTYDDGWTIYLRGGGKIEYSHAVPCFVQYN